MEIEGTHDFIDNSPQRQDRDKWGPILLRLYCFSRWPVVTGYKPLLSASILGTNSMPCGISILELEKSLPRLW